MQSFDGPVREAGRFIAGADSGSLPIFSNCGTLCVEPGRGTSEI